VRFALALSPDQGGGLPDPVWQKKIADPSLKKLNSNNTQTSE
jgi:hypothetical protein